MLGYQYPIEVIRKLEDKSYLIVLEFAKPLTTHENIKSVEAQAFTVNPEFTLYTIVIRYFFFVWSVVGFVLYLLRFRVVPE